MKANNSVILIGSINREPRHNPGKNLIFTVAGTMTEPSGRESSFFHEVMVPGAAADRYAAKCKVDQAVRVFGTLIHTEWEKDDKKHSKVQVKSFDIDFLHREQNDENYASDNSGTKRLRDGEANVSIIGNVGADPDDKKSENAPSRVRVAVTERLANPIDGKDKLTHWFSVIGFDSMQETIGELRKGDRVLIEGLLISETFNDKDGNKRSSTSIKATRLEYIADTKQD